MGEKIRVEIEGKFDENYCLIEGDRAEVWGQNYSSHPYKSRDYPAKLVRVTTRDEAMSLAAANLRLSGKPRRRRKPPRPKN